MSTTMMGNSASTLSEFTAFGINVWRKSIFAVNSLQVMYNKLLCADQFWGFYTPPLNALPNFFIKGNIINHDFMHIDQALKPRPCVPFLLSLLLTKQPHNYSKIKQLFSTRKAWQFRFISPTTRTWGRSNAHGLPWGGGGRGRERSLKLQIDQGITWS